MMFEYTYTCARSWLHTGHVPIGSLLVSPFPGLVIGQLAYHSTTMSSPPTSPKGSAIRTAITQHITALEDLLKTFDR